MSLTLSQPTRSEFGHRFPHEFNPRISIVKSRFSPKPRVDSPSPVSSLRVSATPSDDHHNMSTPHPHRGLPPPSALTLPDPRRDVPPPLPQQFHGLPAPPPQWQGQEDSMRNWLAARAEEEKRKQEEERTRQETLRLEQRKIEQNMLRDSLQGGVPPPMIPFIYTGVGGSLANVSVEWLQQYAGQLQVAQQQIQQTSPDIRRDQGRLIGPPPPPPPQYSVAQPTQQQVLPSQHTEQPPPPPGPIQTTFSAYQPAPGRQQQASAPRSATHTQLPRLTTNEMYVHQAPQPGTGSAHPLQQSQTIQQQDQPSSSPSIYFHHWVPPSESKGGNNPPQTPASKGDPHSAHPSSVHESEFRDSPRKRKAQGGHQANPPPSAGPQYTSPSFSTTSSTSGRKGGHTRNRSNASPDRYSDSRPDSRREDPGPPPPSQQPPPRSSQPESGNTNTSDEFARPPSRAQQYKEEPSSGPDVHRERESRTEVSRPGSS